MFFDLLNSDLLLRFFARSIIDCMKWYDSYVYEIKKERGGHNVCVWCVCVCLCVCVVCVSRHLMRLLAGLKKKGKLMQSCEFANDDDLHSRASKNITKGTKHAQIHINIQTHTNIETPNKQRRHIKPGLRLSPSTESRASNLHFTIEPSKPKRDCH